MRSFRNFEQLIVFYLLEFLGDCLICLVKFKDAVAKKFSAQPEQLCLIFAGKIMKDHETLGTHNVKDGLTVHLVVKALRSGQPNNQEASQQPASRPAGL